MVESDSYGSEHFPIILKIGVSLPNALPRWNLNRADWVQFDHLCKEKLTLGTIELYAEPIILFTDVLCIIAKSTTIRTRASFDPCLLCIPPISCCCCCMPSSTILVC